MAIAHNWTVVANQTSRIRSEYLQRWQSSAAAADRSRSACPASNQPFWHESTRQPHAKISTSRIDQVSLPQTRCHVLWSDAIFANRRSFHDGQSGEMRSTVRGPLAIIARSAWDQTAAGPQFVPPRRVQLPWILSLAEPSAE
jgi:hypothetical protein